MPRYDVEGQSHTLLIITIGWGPSQAEECVALPRQQLTLMITLLCRVEAALSKACVPFTSFLDSFSCNQDFDINRKLRGNRLFRFNSGFLDGLAETIF